MSIIYTTTVKYLYTSYWFLNSTVLYRPNIQMHRIYGITFGQGYLPSYIFVKYSDENYNNQLKNIFRVHENNCEYYYSDITIYSE